MTRWCAWIPAILWAGLISWLSAQPRVPRVGPEFPFKDKVGHWLLFCVLGWCVAWALQRAHNLRLPKVALLAMLITSAYGVADEFHQRFVPNRTCDGMDWLADTFGAGVAVATFYVYESRRSTKANRQTT